MILTDIRELYAYNRWAMDRVFDGAAKLTPEQLGRDLGASHGSFLGTLIHVSGAEWLWVERWKGVSHMQFPDAAEFPTLEAVRAHWTGVDRQRTALFDSLGEDRLQAPLTYRNLKGVEVTFPLVRMMQHVANHASYHRGQLITMFRQLGVPPVPTDMSLWASERFAAQMV